MNVLYKMIKRERIDDQRRGSVDHLPALAAFGFVIAIRIFVSITL